MSGPTVRPCGRTVELATLHAARELKALARVRFARHLRSCQACTTAVREHEATGATLDTLESQRLSAASRERLAAAARRLRRAAAGPPRSSGVGLGRLGALAASLAALLMVVVVAWRWLHPGPVAPGTGAPAAVSDALAWDPAAESLTRLAEEIRALQRPRRWAVGTLSQRDQTLRRIRERMARLEDAQPDNRTEDPWS